MAEGADATAAGTDAMAESAGSIGERTIEPATRGEPLLAVRDLRVSFALAAGQVDVLHGVGWSVQRGQTIVILGESGAGKSVSAYALAGLLPPTARWDGAIRFRGEELRTSSAKQMRQFRAHELGMIFQDPLSSLNPVRRVGAQVGERLRVHGGLDRHAAAARVLELLAKVRLPDPERAARSYPHQLSGGMRQRVMIALAIALGPSLLIADEPTTALDTSVQATVLDLLRGLAADLGMATVLITHDLGVAAAMADHVAVMYAGRIVELGPVERVLTAPAHPYTQALIASTPRLADHQRRKLSAIGGSPPDFSALPSGCAFHPRCPSCFERCLVERPALMPVAGEAEQQAACHLLDDVQASVEAAAPQQPSSTACDPRAGGS